MLWHASFFAILRGIWIERNNRTFRGFEKMGEDAWELSRFNASLWVSVARVSVARLFCNYGLGPVLLD